jgi:hypothetical protein
MRSGDGDNDPSGLVREAALPTSRPIDAALAGGSATSTRTGDAERGPPGEWTLVAYARTPGDVLVVGCPRSGTSLVAQLLSAAGIDFGDALLPPSPDNPRGFVEDLRASDLDDELLAPWVVGRGVLPVPETRLAWVGAPAPGARIAPDAGQLRRMAEVLDGPGRRGLKDPRLVWTLDAWAPALRPGTVHIAPFRHPAEVAASLRTMWERDRPYYGDLAMTVERGLALWEATSQRLLARLARLDRTERDRWFVVDHADLLRGAALPPMARFAQVRLDRTGVDRALHRSRRGLAGASERGMGLLAALRAHASADAYRWADRAA